MRNTEFVSFYAYITDKPSYTTNHIKVLILEHSILKTRFGFSMYITRAIRDGDRLLWLGTKLEPSHFLNQLDPMEQTSVSICLINNELTLNVEG